MSNKLRLPKAPPVDPNEVRMSFGEHLEDLRSCLIRALLGLTVGIILSLLFAKHIFAFVLRPLQLVLQQHGQSPVITVLGPADTFTVYLKIGGLAGAILAAPWMLLQVWRFVASGLYEQERRFVRRFLPATVGLFVAGVLFMLELVLPIVLNFFVGFSANFPAADLTPTFLDEVLIGAQKTHVTTTMPAGPTIPILEGDPQHAADGSVWFDRSTGELKLQTPQGVMIVQARNRQAPSALTNQFALDRYVTFVLSMALSFGLAFELPIAVVLLTLTGIVTVEGLTKSRRYVIFGIAVAAAILTPPDVLSMILLIVPMLLLFEGGLLVAKTLERRRKAEPGGDGPP